MLLLVFKAPWKRKWPQQLPWNWRETQMVSINSFLTTSIMEAVSIFRLTASSNMAACFWTASYWWTHYGQTHVISIKGLSEIGAKTASNIWLLQVLERITCTHSKRQHQLCVFLCVRSCISKREHTRRLLCLVCSALKCIYKTPNTHQSWWNMEIVSLLFAKENLHLFLLKWFINSDCLVFYMTSHKSVGKFIQIWQVDGTWSSLTAPAKMLYC